MAQDNSLDEVPLEQFENSTAVPGVSGRTGAAGETETTQGLNQVAEYTHCPVGFFFSLLEFFCGSSF